jgi:hypothetical protein
VNRSSFGSSPHAGRDQQGRDDAVATQHDLPGEGLHDHADRQRQDDRDQHRDLDRTLRSREGECRGIAENEANHGRPEGDAQRVADDDPVERLGQEARVVRQRETVRAHEAARDQHDDRDREHDHHVDGRRDRQQQHGIEAKLRRHAAWASAG